MPVCKCKKIRIVASLASKKTEVAQFRQVEIQKWRKSGELKIGIAANLTSKKSDLTPVSPLEKQDERTSEK